MIVRDAISFGVKEELLREVATAAAIGGKKEVAAAKSGLRGNDRVRGCGTCLFYHLTISLLFRSQPQIHEPPRVPTQTHKPTKRCSNGLVVRYLFGPFNIFQHSQFYSF